MSTEITTASCAKPEHELFAQRYAATGNALAAYRATYPEASEATARAKATPLTRHPDVARRVAELQRERREQLLRETADLDALVANLATGKATELIDEDGRPVPIQNLPAHVRAAISGLDIELDDEGRVSKYKLKFPDPLAAARLLAQLRGQLIDRKDLTSGGRPLPAVVDPEALPADLEHELRRRLLPGSLEPPIDGEATPVDDGTDLL